MALLDRLAQAQQIVGGYQNQINYAREYQDNMKFAQAQEARAQAGELRSAAAEQRAAELFPIEKASAQFGLAGTALGYQSAFQQLESAEERDIALKEFSAFQGDIYRAMQKTKDLKAEDIASFRNRAIDILGKYPSFAPAVTAAMGQISSVEREGIRAQTPTLADRIQIPASGIRLSDVAALRYIFSPANQRDRLVSGQETTSNLLNLLTVGDPVTNAFFQQQPE